MKVYLDGVGMKPVLFSQHALDLITDRGTYREEVEEAIRAGELVRVKGKRLTYRRNVAFNNMWKGKKYAVKQVIPVVIEDSDRILVVTAFVSYQGGSE